MVFEVLKTSNMTRKPKAKQDEQGRYVSNKAKQKAGLNKSILNVGWHIIETYTQYKAYQADKVVFKIPAPYTSQECAKCGHTHPDNCKSQVQLSQIVDVEGSVRRVEPKAQLAVPRETSKKKS